MHTHLDLVITVDDPNQTVEFHLLDSSRSQIAYKHTDFKNISASRQLGLFNLRKYVCCYVEEGKETAAIAEIGVCIAGEVLGKEIFETLWRPESQRALRIQLPGATLTRGQVHRICMPIFSPTASRV